MSNHPVDSNIWQFRDEIINVKVGDPSINYHVSKSLLCTKSPMFNAALNSQFAEAQNNVYHLSYITQTDFSIFLEWLYNGHLGEQITQLEGNRNKTTDQRNELWKQYFSLYVNAERMLISDLQNVLADRMVAYSSSSCIPPKTAEWAWQNTAEGSPLHQFLIDAFAELEVLNDFVAENEINDSSFLYGIANGMSLREQQGDEVVDKENPARCESYHYHPQGYRPQPSLEICQGLAFNRPS